jgi:beta-phosphoglucomutase-like phosphatase (HAD superfamily)
MMLRALIFDFDGLIVDTESPAYHAWQELYHRHGQELPLELWGQVIGTHEVRFDAMEHLEHLHGEALEREALHADRNLHKTALTDAQPLLPGVRELVEHAGERGIKLGVASSSHHPWVEGHLRRRGILDAFTCICCREDVELTKPHPDLFLASLQCLGVGPAEAVALEDSPNGILAARAAGIFAVAVANPITAQLDLSAADLRLSSLGAMPPSELLAELESRLPG